MKTRYHKQSKAFALSPETQVDIPALQVWLPKTHGIEGNVARYDQILNILSLFFPSCRLRPFKLRLAGSNLSCNLRQQSLRAILVLGSVARNHETTSSFVIKAHWSATTPQWQPAQLLAFPYLVSSMSGSLVHEGKHGCRA